MGYIEWGILNVYEILLVRDEGCINISIKSINIIKILIENTSLHQLWSMKTVHIFYSVQGNFESKILGSYHCRHVAQLIGVTSTSPTHVADIDCVWCLNWLSEPNGGCFDRHVLDLFVAFIMELALSTTVANCDPGEGQEGGNMFIHRCHIANLSSFRIYCIVRELELARAKNLSLRIRAL